MSEPTKRFVVERKTWMRGGEEYTSLRYKDRMCCLGFVCVQSGVDPHNISGKGDPGCLDPRDAKLVPELAIESVSGAPVNSELAEKAMELNDTIGINDSGREAMLRELFASVGLEMVFVDGGES